MEGMFGMFPCVRIYRYLGHHNVERMGRLINWLLGKRMYGLKLQVRPPGLDPEQYPRLDLEVDLRSDLKVDTRLDPEIDLRSDLKVDPEIDPRSDLKVDPKLDLRLDHFVLYEISRHTTSYVVCRLLRLNGF